MDIKSKSGVTKKITRNAPTFLDTPKIIMNNGSVHMIAKYQAKEQCHCSWSKKGVPISEGQKIHVSHIRLNTNCYEYRVEIREPNKYTSGLYKCMVANDNGQMQVYLNLDC